MAKTKGKGGKADKPKPVRAAGKKGAKVEAKKPGEAAPTPRTGPIGGNVTDAELEKVIKAIQAEHKDLDEAQKEVKSINGRIRNKYKELKKKGVNTDALSDMLKQAKLDDQGNVYALWRARFAKIMNLPIGSQLNLLDPEKGGVDAGGGKAPKEPEKPVPLTDSNGLVAKANAHAAGVIAGQKALPCLVPGKWTAYPEDWKRGWEDGQLDNKKTLGKGPVAKKGAEAPDFH